MRVYRDVLGRDAAPAEVSAWQAVGNHAAIAIGILSSTEAHKARVAEDYRKLLRRLPDPGGLTAHTELLDRGLHPDVVKVSLLTSPEYLGTGAGDDLWT